MPKLWCYLPNNLIEKLKKIQEDNKYLRSKTQSQLLKHLIESSIDNLSKNKEKKHSINDNVADIKQTIASYSLQNIALTAEILSCVLDENKIITNKEKTKERAAKIKQKVDNYVEKFFTETTE